MRIDADTGQVFELGLLPGSGQWSLEVGPDALLYGTDGDLLFELSMSGATRQTVLDVPDGLIATALAADATTLYLVAEDDNAGTCDLYTVDLVQAILLPALADLPQCGADGAAISEGTLYLVHYDLIVLGNPPFFYTEVHAVDLATGASREVSFTEFEILLGITDVRGPLPVLEVPTLGGAGLLLLVAALAGVGCVALRLRR